MTRKKDQEPKAEAVGFIVEEAEPAGLKEEEAPPAKTGPGCFSRLFGLFGIALCVGLILAFLAGLKYSVLFLPASETSREVVVNIPEGASPARIGDILEQAGVIKSAQAFVWTIRVKNRLGKTPVILKAGEMALDPSQRVWQVIDSLARGTYKLYPFTVPEGRNIYDIAQMVESQGFGPAAEFLELCRDKSFIRSLGLNLDSLEGYLFPETYNFPKGTTLKGIIKDMTSVFHKVWRKY
ncbi:MAG: endolytic transglycosylase MltG, partial [Candidatus Adiutrix sp.]|nr:endolytic transglycosylase MltG [Candidatus Adiutrix sp.]